MINSKIRTLFNVLSLFALLFLFIAPKTQAQTPRITITQANGYQNEQTGKCEIKLTWNLIQTPPGTSSDDFELQLFLDNNLVKDDFVLSATTYTITNLTCGRRYTYRLQLRQLFANSNPEVVSFAENNITPQAVQGRVGGVTVNTTKTSGANTCQATLRWRRVGSIDNTSDDIVKIGITLEGGPKTDTPLDISATSYTFRGLTCNRSYNYRFNTLEFTSGSGNSGWENYNNRPNSAVSGNFRTPDDSGNGGTNTGDGSGDGSGGGSEDDSGDGSESTGEFKCSDRCKQTFLGRLSVGKSIQYAICQIQCAIVNGIAEMIGWLVNNILKRALLL